MTTTFGLELQLVLTVVIKEFCLKHHRVTLNLAPTKAFISGGFALYL